MSLSLAVAQAFSSYGGAWDGLLPGCNMEADLETISMTWQLECKPCPHFKLIFYPPLFLCSFSSAIRQVRRQKKKYKEKKADVGFGAWTPQIYVAINTVHTEYCSTGSGAGTGPTHRSMTQQSVLPPHWLPRAWSNHQATVGARLRTQQYNGLIRTND